jgi:mono/diheme cytochrome c family protein
LFAVLYAVLLAQMIPRLWRFEGQAWEAGTIAHAVMGAAMLPIPALKVAIIRRLQRLGKRLPLLGWTMTIFALTAVAIVSPAYLAVTSGEQTGAALVRERCFSCHGASRIANEDGDLEDWLKTVDDMRENAEDLRRADPVQSDAVALAAYLAAIHAERE